MIVTNCLKTSRIIRRINKKPVINFNHIINYSPRVPSTTILFTGVIKLNTTPPEGQTGFDSQETKLPTYWNKSKICLSMKIGEQIRFIVINMKASFLYSLIADGKNRSTSLGRATWKKLIGSEASLQVYCNTEGFNMICSGSYNSKARIGIASNNQDDCLSCDSRIGFGTGGRYDPYNTCGNEATRETDNGDKHIKAMGYILVY